MLFLVVYIIIVSSILLILYNQNDFFIGKNMLEMNIINHESKKGIDPIMFRGFRDLYINNRLMYYNDTGAKNIFAPQITYEGSDIPVRYEFSVNNI